jgi:exodeoxyribonuclease-3
VCGDFNVAHQEIDLARPKENRESAGFSQRERDDFTQILSDCDMVDIWRERNPDTIKYSWWSFRFGARKKNIGWRIDYFLVSRNILQEVKSTDILDKIEGSDHAPLQLVLKDA